MPIQDLLCLSTQPKPRDLVETLNGFSSHSIICTPTASLAKSREAGTECARLLAAERTMQGARLLISSAAIFIAALDLISMAVAA